MMSIPTDTIGRIIAGDECGSFVKVMNDSASTGGYLIFTSPNPDFSEGFDNWVANAEQLEGYFLQSMWQIEWLPPTPDSPPSTPRG